VSGIPDPTVEVSTYRLERLRRKVSHIGVGLEQLRIVQEELVYIVDSMTEEDHGD
jgi:hypothetical protein